MKTFVIRDALLKVTDNNCVGGREGNRHCQGVIFVKGKNKAAALETLKSLDYDIRATSVRIGMGNDLEALSEAGVITEDSLVLTSNHHPWMVAKVSTDENGERTVAGIGNLTRNRETNRFVFVPVS